MNKFLPRVLNNPNFLKLWLAQIFSQFGLNILNFVLLLKVYEKTTSNTSVSILLLAFGIPGLLLGYLAGSYVDRVNTRTVLIITNVIRFGTLLLLFFLPEKILVYYVVALVIAVASQFFIPAEGSIMPALVPQKLLLEANSLFTSTLYVMTIIGFILAGPSLRLFNTQGTALLIGFAFLLALVCVWSLPKPLEHRVEPDTVKVLQRLFHGLKFVWQNVGVRNALFFLTLTQTIFLVIAAIAPGYVNKNLQIDVKEASIVLVAPAALGLLIGAITINKFAKKYSTRSMVTAGLLGMGICLTLLTIANIVFPGRLGVWATVMLSGIVGVGIAYINIPAATAMQVDTEEDLRGRMYGLLVSLQSGASLMPIILAGAFADLFGTTFVLQLMGVIVFLLGLYRLRGRLF